MWRKSKVKKFKNYIDNNFNFLRELFIQKEKLVQQLSIPEILVELHVADGDYN